MTAMAGFNIQASIQLQPRVLSISWVKKSGVFACLKARACSSSGPVRYIPKGSSNDEKSRTHLTPEIVNGNDFSSELDVNAPNIEVKHRSAVPRSNFNDTLRDDSQYEKNNYSAGGSMLGIYMERDENQYEKNNYSAGGSMLGLDDDFDDNLSYVDELLEEAEEVDEELNIYDKKCYDGNNVGGNQSKQDAEKLAIELLATRSFTAVELRKKLLGKKVSLNAVEAVINDFKIRGLINEGLYAETFSYSRWSSSSWGPRKIKQALVTKGIGREVAQKAVKLVFEDDEESGEGMRVALSKVSMDRLFVQASKQWMRGQYAPRETRKSRIVRWLQYRGFDWGVTRTILKMLETKYPP